MLWTILYALVGALSMSLVVRYQTGYVRSSDFIMAIVSWPIVLIGLVCLWAGERIEKKERFQRFVKWLRSK